MLALKLVELCAGTGAFSLACSQSSDKIKTIYANDLLPESQTIFGLNFPDVKFHLGDLLEVSLENIPKMDILTCGFSCQPFSVAGKQKGFEDERSEVFWKTLEIVKFHQPRFVILENVKNLLSHDNGKTFERMKSFIETDTKYFMKYQLIDTSTYTGIPQHRERVYMVLFREISDYNSFKFNEQEEKVNNIKNYLEDKPLEKYYYSDRYVIWNELEKSVKKHIEHNVVYQYRRKYVRENKSGLVPTLVKAMGTGGHNVPIIKDDNGIRKLTPRECFNLQGFPLEYNLGKLSDTKLYGLSGNAITVDVAKKIMNSIISLISKE